MLESQEMRKVYCDTMIALAKEDPRIVDVEADLTGALDSLGKESLKQLLEADVSSIVDRAVRQTAVENGLPAHSPEVEVVICLVTIMMAGAVESWLRGELTQTPEELTRRIDMMFQDYIRGVALRRKAPAAVYT